MAGRDVSANMATGTTPVAVDEGERQGPTASGTAAKRAPVPHTEELLLSVRYCASSKRDITLCYQCFGDPNDARPAVLLVCGLNMQLYAWDEAFCEALVRAGFFVIRYDNRDIGYSTKIEKCGSVVAARLLLPTSVASAFGEKLPYTLDDMAKDGLALLTALKIPRAHVFGISMGGAIAQLMGLISPEMVMSITTLMSTTNPPDLPDSQMWVKLHMLRSPPKNCSVEELLEFRANSLKKLLQHALPVDDAYLKHRYWISLNRSSYSKGLIRQAAALRRCPPRDEPLKKVTIPALVIHGVQDLVVPPNHGFRTAQCMPHARMLVLKSMGHYFHPAFFPTIVVAFADMASTTAGPGLPTVEGPVMLSDSAAPAPVEGRPPQLMASMGSMLRPVVTTERTRVGAAAARAVNVAVPGVGDPMLPEAVLLDLHSDDGADAEVTSYVVGSPSTWNSASFPSPIRKTGRGAFVMEDKAVAATAAAAVALPGQRVVPDIRGTPLNTVIGQGTSRGTETTGGRRSHPTSRCPSFQHFDEAPIAGISPAQPLPSADAEDENVDPQATATADDVAATMLPPMLPGSDLGSAAETATAAVTAEDEKAFPSSPERSP